LFAPTSVKIDEDRLAVLEPFKQQISLYTPDGQVHCKIDIEGDASGLARLSENAYLFCDRDRKDVIAVNISTGSQYSLANGWISFEDPVDIEIDSLEYYFLDAGSNGIIIANSVSHQIRRIELLGQNGERMRSPSNFEFNKSAQTFYVFDQTTSKTWVFSYSGQYLSKFCSFGSSDGEVSRGGEIACDPDGNIYIVDRYQGRIAIFTPAGEFMANIGLAELGLPSHSLPAGIDIDDQGFLYVSSTEGKTIDIIYVNPAGSPRRLAALQAYPADNDTVEAAELELIAIIDNNPEGFTITGFDFQLFASGDTSETVAENFKAAPEIKPGNKNIEQAVISKWAMEDKLDDESTYQWRVRAVSGEIIGEWSPLLSFHTSSLPRAFSLRQNYPNPFNPITHIAFETPIQTDAIIKIYNTLGQEVKSFDFYQLPAGKHDIIWNGTDNTGSEAASGIYFYRMTTETFSKTKKMALLK